MIETTSIQGRVGFGSSLPPPIAESEVHVSVDPVTLMINECMILSSSMRKSSRWSQSGVAAILGAGDIFGGSSQSNGGANDEDSLHHTLSISGNTSSRTNDNPLFSSFLQLRSILTEGNKISDIDSLTLLQPFLLTIKSSSTSGNITSLALNSVYKLLNYGIISLSSKNIQVTLVQIISSLTHCRFEAADQNSDDAVLLKVLRLLESIVQSHLSELLPDDVVSEIVQTCLSLACNKKRSEVLRKSAEIAMVSITFRIFSKLRDIQPERIDLQTNFQDAKLPEDVIGAKESKATDSKDDEKDSVNQELKEETQRISKEAEETAKDKDSSTYPYGIVAINEFLGILISIISPANQFQHMESTRVFALSLIDTAIEVAGSEFPKHPSLFSLVSDSVSKHILQILTTTESPVLLQASLRVFSTLAIVLGRQLKSQIELSLNLICQSILPENTSTNGNAEAKATTSKNQSNTPPSKADPLKNASISTRSPTSKEMLIESLSLLWTRSPVFFTNLFIDYDCDFDKSDLASQLLRFLCQLSLPEAAITTTESVPPICLESILSFIGGINDRIKSLSQMEVGELDNHGVANIIEIKKKKTLFIQCSHILNQKPKEGIRLLVQHGFISDAENLPELAEFFFTKSARLNKKVLGEVLSKPSNQELLTEFINRFDFAGVRVDEALRILLKTFRLPGESQQIQRIVETFATRYVSCHQDSEPVGDEEPVKPNADSVFILSYSIIMLNTDLHNPQVKRQMLLEDYKKNLRGMYNGTDYPDWYMAKIYSSIKDKEIIMPEEHHGTDKWFDDAWNNLISSEVSSTEQSLVEHSLVATCQFDKVLFEAVVDDVIETLIAVFKEASDDHIITRLMSSIDKCANVCIYYNLAGSIDKLISSLADLTSLTSGSNRVMQADENLRDEIPITQIKVEQPREEVITVSETAVWFGRDFKAQLSTVVLFRLIKKSDCKVSNSWSKVIRIILTLFENCLINPNLFGEFQKKIRLSALPRVKPRYIISRTKPTNNSGILSTFSSFLKGYSDEPPEPSDQEIESTLSTIDCVKSVNIPGIFEGISRGPVPDLKLFVTLLLDELPSYGEESKRFFETEILFLFEVAVCFCLLSKDQTLISLVLNKLTISDVSKKGSLRLISYKLLLLRHTKEDIKVVSTLLHQILEVDKELLVKQGMQILQPLLSLADDDSWCSKEIIVAEDFWKVLRVFGSIPAYASELLTFVETIVKQQKDIVPENYMPFLGLLDEISSLGAIGSQYEQKNGEVEEAAHFEELIAHSKKSISLTAELQGVSSGPLFKDRDLSYSLIQALAHQCFNPCREVRGFALSTLSVTVLSADTSRDVSAFGIFEYGLFPLLAELSKPDVLQTDVNGFTRTQIEALSLLSKVFLKFSGDFSKEDLARVWIGVLDNVVALSAKGDDKFKESVVEAVKNMILVLQSFSSDVSGGVLSDEIWVTTWEKIEVVYPGLKDELQQKEKEIEEKEEERASDKLKEEEEAKGAEEEVAKEVVEDEVE